MLTWEKRVLRKHGKEGKGGEKDKWKWGDWKPQVSLLIYQQHGWQPLGSKWMWAPQGSGPLLSNGDKEQRKGGQEGGRGEYGLSKWRGTCLRQDFFVYCTGASMGKTYSIFTLYEGQNFQSSIITITVIYNSRIVLFIWIMKKPKKKEEINHITNPLTYAFNS